MIIYNVITKRLFLSRWISRECDAIDERFCYATQIFARSTRKHVIRYGYKSVCFCVSPHIRKHLVDDEDEDEAIVRRNHAKMHAKWRKYYSKLKNLEAGEDDRSPSEIEEIEEVEDAVIFNDSQFFRLLDLMKGQTKRRRRC